MKTITHVSRSNQVDFQRDLKAILKQIQESDEFWEMFDIEHSVCSYGLHNQILVYSALIIYEVRDIAPSLPLHVNQLGIDQTKL